MTGLSVRDTHREWVATIPDLDLYGAPYKVIGHGGGDAEREIDHVVATRRAQAATFQAPTPNDYAAPGDEP